ncbi:MAG TPA: signal recognition particle receptor subunit alpha, partial [Pseudomonadales bacterium]|nr:signal recognition particle receptor subunit alpha [Pseudomonadales bacterium]
MFKFLKRNNTPQTPEAAGSGTASPSAEHDAEAPESSPSPIDALLHEPAPTADTEPQQAQAAPTVAAPAETEPSASKPGLFSRIRSGLTRTRVSLAEGLSNLILGRKQIDAELLEALEEQLLLADVGMAATRQIIDQLSDRVARKQLADADALHAALRAALSEILQPVSLPLQIDDSKRPYVLLVIGVNGVGKTTT